MRLFRRNVPDFAWYANEPHLQRDVVVTEVTNALVTVAPHEAVVAYRPNGMVKVYRTGRHFLGLSARASRVDLRWRREVLAPQEIPTADGALVKVTASFSWRVGDPETFLASSAKPTDEIYLAIQVRLREALIGYQLEQLAAAPRLDEAIEAGITTRATEVGQELGVEVGEVVVKDVILPAEWRHAVMGITLAKLEGQSKLEAARAETAALRALANQEKLLAENPALAKLQLMKAAAGSGRLELSYAPFD